MTQPPALVLTPPEVTISNTAPTAPTQANERTYDSDSTGADTDAGYDYAFTVNDGGSQDIIYFVDVD